MDQVSSTQQNIRMYANLMLALGFIMVILGFGIPYAQSHFHSCGVFIKHTSNMERDFQNVSRALGDIRSRAEMNQMSVCYGQSSDVEFKWQNMY